MTDKEAQLNEGTIRVRAATPDDMEILLSLERACFSVYYYAEHQFYEEHFAYFLGNKHYHLWLAFVDDTPAAYVLGRITTRGASRSARFDSLAVAPAYRRMGLGRHLMRVFADMARKLGCRRIWLEVAEANVVGIEMFTAMGFRFERRLPGYYGPEIDGLRMRLELEVFCPS